MPEQFEYVKEDPYAMYGCHLPIFTHCYKSTLLAGSLDLPDFTITPNPGLRVITIGQECHQLIGNINRSGPMVVALDGPEAVPPIVRTQKNTTEIGFIVRSVSYRAYRKEYHAFLTTGDGNEIARITAAWKDRDTEKKIKFWMHSFEAVPPLVAALFFCLGQTYEELTEYGMVVNV